MIEAWLKDSDWARAAGRHERLPRPGRTAHRDRGGLKDSDCDVRQAAMNACQGRDVPLTVIEAWLKDSDWRVRQAAMNACQAGTYRSP